MALRTLALAAVTVAVLPWSNGAALAFDRGCGRAVECYDRVRVPDTYATVERPVIVRPGFREVVQMPPVVSVRHDASWSPLRASTPCANLPFTPLPSSALRSHLPRSTTRPLRRSFAPYAKTLSSLPAAFIGSAAAVSSAVNASARSQHHPWFALSNATSSWRRPSACR